MSLIVETDIKILLTGLTLLGPDIITQYPGTGKSLSREERLAIAMKSLPVGGKCGDMINVTLNNYQLIFVLLLVPAFEFGIDTRDTTVSLGLMIPENINPLPYQAVLKNIASICFENKILNIEYLEIIMKELYKTILNDKENKFSINIDGNVIEFFLDKGLSLNRQSLDKNKLSSTSQLKPVLSKEETLERETNAFVVDKYVLNTITNEYPVSIELIWKKALKLEPIIGSRIELSMIIEICKKYIEQGIIKQI